MKDKGELANEIMNIVNEYNNLSSMEIVGVFEWLKLSLFTEVKNQHLKSRQSTNKVKGDEENGKCN